MGYSQSLTRLYLLDTHVWLWTVEGDHRRIGRRTARLLNRWAQQEAMRISPLSVFEVSYLHGTGRVAFARTLDQWMSAALENVRGRLAPVTTEIAILGGTIGGRLVSDPVDRLLIATARELGATLVTADRRILDYADSAGSPAVHDARR